MNKKSLVMLGVAVVFTGLGLAQQNNSSQPGTAAGGPAANRSDGTGASRDGVRPAAPGIPSGLRPAQVSASPGLSPVPTPGMTPAPSPGISPVPTPGISPAPTPGMSPLPAPSVMPTNPVMTPATTTGTSTKGR